MALVKDSHAARTCGVCQRSLLLGEHSTRFKPANGDWVEVCALCRVPARELGWVKEGGASSPVVPLGRRRLRLPRIKRSAEPPAAPAPANGSRDGTTQVDCFALACTTFNESAFRRTVAGIAKSLGDPEASLVYLTGVKPEVVITVAWDLSWYQYRVVIAETPSIRLVERGYELEELDQGFRSPNARFGADMSLSSPDDGSTSGDVADR